MSIHFNIEGATADEVLTEMRVLFTALTGSAPVPQTTEPPMRGATLADAAEREIPGVKSGEIIEPAPKKTRAKKDKEPETIDNLPLSTGASTAGAAQSVSTSSEQDNSSTSASDAPLVPDLDDVRAKLKTLGATDGLGHDKVFEVLGKYGAKNASTVPEDKRAALITEIDELLKGAN